MTQNNIYAKNPIIQVQHTSTTAVVTCSTAIPYDNTIPQNTEGTEVLTLAITPKSTSSILEIVFSGNVQQNATSKNIQTALFQDSTAGALAAASTYGESNTDGSVGYLRHIMTAGTTSSTTFKIRIGPAASTLYVNGNGGGTRLFGGVCSTTLLIREYQA